MVRGFVIRTRVGRDPDRVWARLVDPKATGPGHRCMDPHGADAVVTEYEPKRSYALSAHWKDIHTTHRYTLRGSRRGTELVLRLICDVDGRWWINHSVDVLGLWARDRLRLRRLKRELEREGD